MPTEAWFVMGEGDGWLEAPGEFRRVLGVFPLGGDTLVVIEPFRATRVLKDGTYIDGRFIPFDPAPLQWARHSGEYWVSGLSRDGAVPLLRLSRSEGLDVLMIRGRASPDQRVSGQPVSWNGELWLWEYPQGPLRRINTATGEAVETWDPPIGDDDDETWRAFAVGGPDDTIIFRLDPTFEWVVFDAQRRKLFSQSIPAEYRTVYLVDSMYGRTFSMTDEPVTYADGIRVFGYRIVR